MFFALLRLATNPSAVLSAIHAKHGNFIQTSFFSKKLLFCSSPDHFEEIFSREAKGFINRDSLYDAKKSMFGNGLFNSNGETWTNQRQLMQPHFAKQGVAAWQDIMLDESNASVLRIKTSNQNQLNISREIKEIIQKIMVRVLFSRPMSGPADEQLMASVDTIVKGLFPHLLAETLGKGKLKNLLFLQNKRMNDAIKHFVSYVDNAIERSEHDKTDAGLISLLLQSRKSTGYCMSNQLLRDEAITMFLAGQDSTVNTLAWFFYLIGKNERVHKTITDEIHNHINEPLTQKNIEKLSYTKAALYETLRLYPQAIALSRDVADPMILDGKTIEKNTSIIMSIYATHRNPEIWQNPNDFYPEHFLNDTANGRHKFAFLPFGGGMHTCIGRHFAELEMMLIIATLLRAITVRTNVEIKPTVSITYKPKRDVIVSITQNQERS